MSIRNTYESKDGYKFEIDTYDAKIVSTVKWGFKFLVKETTGTSGKPSKETFLVVFSHTSFETREAAAAFIHRDPLSLLQSRYLEQYPYDTCLPTEEWEGSLIEDDEPIEDRTFFEKNGWDIIRGPKRIS
jgi:hypothetical protein